MLVIKKSVCLTAFVAYTFLLQAQSIKPNLQELDKWSIVNRTAAAVHEDGKNAIRINEIPNDGQMILKGYQFSNGTIEVDIKGKNAPQQSFVGIAFHGMDDKTYDAIYFRPFNFMNADTIRRWRSVQYISMPDYPWEKLRQNFPGKYENKVNPVPNPDGWFHVKIVVDGKKVTVFVNGAQTHSLAVEKLTSTTTGNIALWVGNNSGGSFANLVITKN